MSSSATSQLSIESDAQIEGLHKGEFPETPEIKCYAECTLRTAQILKDGKLNVESLRTQMAALPKQYSEPGLVTIEKCKDTITGADKCEAAYSFYKCFYNDNPGNFFLP
ncbi:hypothetical protein ILUMI_06285 [Ignelater luminosus]|uniref:Uncharacterized protein n=1 Tax=Ignelater luminosus TaxID=2038154 RepID=A0A8K0DBD9_IGNLU|nr:hypothetical protein ILUMI_06285 [Ignelater luminosus]